MASATVSSNKPERVTPPRRRDPRTSKRWRVGLRATLLLTLLPLVTLPWIGMRFVERMAELTRDERLENQAATARSLAAALYDRPELFSGEDPARQLPEGAQLLPVESVPILGTGAGAREWQGLPSRPLPVQISDSAPLDTLKVRITAARTRPDAAILHLLIQVDDERLVRPQPAATGMPALPGDELIVEAGATPNTMMRVTAAIQEREGGWRAAVTVGAHARLIRVRVNDVDYLGTRRMEAEADSGLLAPVSVAPPDDDQRDQAIRASLLRTLDHVSGRVSVFDAGGRMLVQRGEVHTPAPAPSAWVARVARALLVAAVRTQPEFISTAGEGRAAESVGQVLSPLAQALAGTPAQQSQRLGVEAGLPSWLLSSAQPIWSRDRIVGALLLEEDSAARLALGRSTLERLTLLAALAIGGSVLSLLVLASVTVGRVVRLRDEADAAIDARGRVIGTIRGSGLGDELGQLRDRHARVLARLREHQDYLAKLRSRLVHELRTPIMVVRSSVENLAAEGDPARREAYVQRVQSGAARLERIVASMGEASSMESMLADSELERVDLGRLLQGCVEGYRSAFESRDFELLLPDGDLRCPVVPEAVAQALDKLVSNAVDFARPGTPIVLTLARRAGHWRLTVRNQGPSLPDLMADSLFDAMVSVRAERASDRAHLGLGLYLVRLIAEFHGGRAFVTNVPDGVEAGFTVSEAGGR